MAGTTSLTSPPPVPVALESLAPSTEPARCPPTGRPGARATSSRSSATSPPTPTRRPRSSPCSSSSTAQGAGRHRLHAQAQRQDGGQSRRLQEGRRRLQHPLRRGPRRSSGRRPTTASTPRTPSTSPGPTRPWAANDTDGGGPDRRTLLSDGPGWRPMHPTLSRSSSPPPACRVSGGRLSPQGGVVGEDAPVGRSLVVPAGGGVVGHAHDRLVEGQGGGRAVGRCVVADQAPSAATT